MADTEPAAAARTAESSLRDFVSKALFDNEQHVEAVLAKLGLELISTQAELIECFEQAQDALPALARKRLADHILRQDPTMTNMARQARSARDKLRLWVERSGDHFNFRVAVEFGGLEGICTLLRMASIDKDGDGIISPEELKEIAEADNALINDAVTFSTNSGIVSALILTMFVPMELSDPSNDTIRVFNQTAADALAYTAYVCDAFIVLSGFIIVFMSSMMLIWLSFALPTRQIKVTFVRDSAVGLNRMVMVMYLMLWVFLASILFKGLLQSPYVGWAAGLPLIVALIWCFTWWLPNIAKTARMIKAEAEELLSSGEVAIHQSGEVAIHLSTGI